MFQQWLRRQSDSAAICIKRTLQATHADPCAPTMIAEQMSPPINSLTDSAIIGSEPNHPGSSRHHGTGMSSKRPQMSGKRICSDSHLAATEDTGNHSANTCRIIRKSRQSGHTHSDRDDLPVGYRRDPFIMQPVQRITNTHSISSDFGSRPIGRECFSFHLVFAGRFNPTFLLDCDCDKTGSGTSDINANRILRCSSSFIVMFMRTGLLHCPASFFRLGTTSVDLSQDTCQNRPSFH